MKIEAAGEADLAAVGLSRRELQEERGQSQGKQTIYFLGYDGKAIEVDLPDSSSGGASSGASGEVALQQENQKLREAMKFVVEQITPNAEAKEKLPDHVKDLLKEDPRQNLKQRQKELNEERKQLNKLAKVKEALEKKEAKYNNWHHTMTAGFKKEEKRYTTEIAELQEEVKSLERQRDGIDPIEVDDSEEESNAVRYLHKEIGDLKEGMSQMIVYTADTRQSSSRRMPRWSKRCNNRCKPSSVVCRVLWSHQGFRPKNSHPNKGFMRRKWICLLARSRRRIQAFEIALARRPKGVQMWEPLCQWFLTGMHLLGIQRSRSY